MRIGPNFGVELAAAGLLQASVTWTEGGVDRDGAAFAALTVDQRKRLEEVVSRHDPNKVNLRSAALEALQTSDVTILRCCERGVGVPSEWTIYRAALRSIVAGADSASTELPIRPNYPVGT